MVRPADHEDARKISARAWVDRLVEGGRGAITYPAFPTEGIQRQFVGSAFADAMAEALRFYQFIHRYVDSSWIPARRQTSRLYARARGSYLDFGCGWGRFSRLFLRDFPGEQIVGVDIDADIIGFCNDAGLPGTYIAIGPPPLEFGPESFRLVTAYSVFSHLPPALFRAWLLELGRVLAPGGLLALTVEPPRFLDFIDGLPEAPGNPWHAGLVLHRADLSRHKLNVQHDGITFLPTGGGGVRTADVYGDTVVKRSFVESVAQSFGRVVAYVDDPRRFWQAAVIIQKP